MQNFSAESKSLKSFYMFKLQTLKLVAQILKKLAIKAFVRYFFT